MLTCTICGARPSFAKVRLEITGGAVTYLVCTDVSCILEATRRSAENLCRAASNLSAPPTVGDVIDANVVGADEWRPDPEVLAEIRRLSALGVPDEVLGPAALKAFTRPDKS